MERMMNNAENEMAAIFGKLSQENKITVLSCARLCRIAEDAAGKFHKKADRKKQPHELPGGIKQR
jgi:hypothetical protein